MSRKTPPRLAAGFRAMLEAAAEAAGVASFADLLAAPRSKTFSMWRQALMLVLREQRQMSFPEIGWVFGFDHTTVMHGVARARRARDTNEGGWPQAIARLETLVRTDRPCFARVELCQGTVENG